MRRPHILIIDDEKDICSLLAEILSSEQWTVEWTTKPMIGLEKVQSDLFELVILDIKMPEISGLDLLPRIKAASPETAVLMMSAYGNVSIAVQAMRDGAEDYIEKPFRDVDEIRVSIARLIENARVRIENRLLRQQLEEKFTLDGLVSASPLMQEVFDLIKRIAPIPTTVLILGETGTGKELMARTIHRYSRRSQGPFISINCGGLPENLLESLLFGHEKGAFTGAARRTRGYFAEAEGGTLFLDEIGDMPPPLQVKLLRVLQERTIQRVGSSDEIPVDVRLIAATNKNLDEEIKKGNFRQDLYFRLNVISVRLPALRDRREDIPLLAQYFVEKYSKAFKRPAVNIESETINHLCDYSWPGNVRELENIVERSVALADGKAITIDMLETEINSPSENFINKLLNLPLKSARQVFEKQYLTEVLARNNGSVTRAAQTAGLPRQNYHRKMKQLGITARKKAHQSKK